MYAFGELSANIQMKHAKGQKHSCGKKNYFCDNFNSMIDPFTNYLFQPGVMALASLFLSLSFPISVAAWFHSERDGSSTGC